MLIYLIAGEPSGDTLGARLMRALKDTGEDITFAGIGGENMEKEGLKSLFDITDLAVMGLAEVIPSIPKVLRRIRETVADIASKKPDAVVSIDSWSYCSRVHKALRRKKIKTLQIHYVAPQVWAWKKGRAKTMYKYIDRLLTLFPNEPAYFTPYNLPTDYVGHPAIEGPHTNITPQTFRQKYNIPAKKRIVLLLPGSRHNEVTRLLPIFLEAAGILQKKYKDLHFVLPTVKTVEKDVETILRTQQLADMTVVNKAEDRAAAMSSAAAAMAASGTVSLELAIAGIPHIIAYMVSPLTAFIARRILKIKSVNLPNIILGRRVVDELLQEDCQAEKIAQETEKYLNGNLQNLQKFQEEMSALHHLLGIGRITPGKNAAEIVIKAIKEHIR